MESTLKKNGVTISKFLFLRHGRFQPNCGRKAAQPELKLRSTSTPATAAAAVIYLQIYAKLPLLVN